MILDTEQQRQVLLGLIAQATFKGEHLDIVYSLRQSIVAAQIASPDTLAQMSDNGHAA